MTTSSHSQPRENSLLEIWGRNSCWSYTQSHMHKHRVRHLTWLCLLLHVTSGLRRKEIFFFKFYLLIYGQKNIIMSVIIVKIGYLENWHDFDWFRPKDKTHFYSSKGLSNGYVINPIMKLIIEKNNTFHQFNKIINNNMIQLSIFT